MRLRACPSCDVRLKKKHVRAVFDGVDSSVCQGHKRCCEDSRVVSWQQKASESPQEKPFLERWCFSRDGFEAIEKYPHPRWKRWKTSSEGVMAPVQARGKYREVCKGLHSGGGGE